MKKVQGNDSFQRINYLYQISKYISGKNSALSSYYGNLIISVAKKNVLKIWMKFRNTKTNKTLESPHSHPDMKRQMCKKCKCILINNTSAKMRIKNKNKAKSIEWECNTCGTRRTFPASKNKDHRVWLEKPESVVEVVK